MSNSGIYEEDYGQDSDHESLYADTDSPTDGYFSQRSFPCSQFVENSSITAEAEAKAQEAVQSRAGSSEAQPPSQSHSPRSPTRSLVWANSDEQMPLLDAGPAPPDYAAATAHRATANSDSPDDRSSASESPQSYGSITEDRFPHSQWPFGDRGSLFNSSSFPFGTSGSPFGPQRNANQRNFDTIFHHGQPQSMSGNHQGVPGGSDEETGFRLGQSTRRRKREWWRMGYCTRPRSFFAWVLLFMIVLCLVFANMLGSQETTPTPSDPSNPNLGTPSDGGKGEAGIPGVRNPPQAPVTPGPPKIPNFPANRSLSHCPFAAFTNTQKFDFSSRDFNFVEVMETRAVESIDLSGTVWIQPAPKEQDVDIRAHVAFATTRDWRVGLKRFVQQRDTLRLQFPSLEKLADKDPHEQSCLDVSVAISVREGVQLEDLVIMTANLNVKVEEGLFRSKDAAQPPVNVANSASITAIRGKVDLDYWSSRETVIDVISGSIQGHFALRDLLVLRSQSGSISAMVEPEEADSSKPLPADLSVASTSGNIHVELPMSGDIKDRDYRTRIESRSGSISGDYYLGSSTTMTSRSSSIKATILPYDGTSWAASLRTDSRSGSTDLRVLPSHKSSDKPLGHVHCDHKTGSSSLKLRYPSQWSGTIEGESMTGSIHVHGRDVHIDKDEHFGHVVNHVLAHKDDGGSTIDFHSRSGSVDLAIGEN